MYFVQCSSYQCGVRKGYIYLNDVDAYLAVESFIREYALDMVSEDLLIKNLSDSLDQNMIGNGKFMGIEYSISEINWGQELDLE